VLMTPEEEIKFLKAMRTGILARRRSSQLTGGSFREPGYSLKELEQD